MSFNVLNWYISLAFLYAFENNTPKDSDIIIHILAIEKILNDRIFNS